MTTKSRTRIWRILLLAAVLAVAACSESTSTTTAEPTDNSTDDASSDESAAEDATSGAAETDSDESAAETDGDDGASETDADGTAGEDTTVDVVAAGPGVDTALFYDGAIVGDPTIGECTLVDGSVSQCYTITVAGTPANHEIGPFCPTSISEGADAGGVWLDGVEYFEIDGAFFTELAEIYGDDAWNNIYNDDGSVNVIDSAEEFAVAARPDITEEYYYHCVDGKIEWLDGGVLFQATVQIPVTPVLAETPTEFARLHNDLGITLNGVLLSGAADMDAILASYTIAAFDDCGGHINPALGYHVHGTAGCSDVGEVAAGETAPFAYALDGFTVHAPYDDADAVELDECNGHTSDEYGYHYHAAPLEDNATLVCFSGLTVMDDGGPGGGGGRGTGGERGAPPEE
jgi:hypothetical protein